LLGAPAALGELRLSFFTDAQATTVFEDDALHPWLKLLNFILDI
jgi:hypothetical protein